MDFLLNAVSNFANLVANGASNFCMMMFYEPEVPESLREEE